jgi:hypothetical protein
MDNIIAKLDEPVVALALAFAMLAAWGAGNWLGRRLVSKGGSRFSKFDDASMALMGLLLAFAFGTAIAKYDQRRLAIVADSNAIGDFYTCAALLNEPTRTELQAVIERYAQFRLDVSRRQLSDADLNTALSRFDRMHSQMIELVGQALAAGTPIAVSLTNTLNAMSSNQASRLSAIRDRLPASIVILLLASAIITALLIGRQQGSTDDYEMIGALCFVLVVSIAVYVTLDLNSPGHGLIRTSQEPIERLIGSMHQ